jgi:signal transduction histidine kinase
MLSVSDTGQGIPPHLVDRLFDPVYLNVDGARATGLGLSTVQGIVKSHGGFLEASSAPGKGTTVQIYLPAHLER